MNPRGDISQHFVEQLTHNHLWLGTVCTYTLPRQLQKRRRSCMFWLFSLETSKFSHQGENLMARKKDPAVHWSLPWLFSLPQVVLSVWILTFDFFGRGSIESTYVCTTSIVLVAGETCQVKMNNLRCKGQWKASMQVPNTLVTNLYIMPTATQFGYHHPAAVTCIIPFRKKLFAVSECS